MWQRQEPIERQIDQLRARREQVRETLANIDRHCPGHRAGAPLDKEAQHRREELVTQRVDISEEILLWQEILVRGN
jgi:FtsZ-binding cell division protein ZapB